MSVVTGLLPRGFDFISLPFGSYVAARAPRARQSSVSPTRAVPPLSARLFIRRASPRLPYPLLPYPKAKRSESILAFLAKRNAVTTSQLDLLWSSTLGKHEVRRPLDVDVSRARVETSVVIDRRELNDGGKESTPPPPLSVPL